MEDSAIAQVPLLDAEDALDIPSKPEARGIEHIEDDDRHGKPGELFWVWAAPSVSFISFSVGALMILLGLNLWQSITVIVAGNAFWALTGYIASSGKAAGTSGSVISRAMFGIHGNRPMVAIFGWLMGSIYLAMSWGSAAANGAGLLDTVGVDASLGLQIGIILVVAAITLVLAIYGHAFIVKIYPYLTIVLGVIFLAMAFMLSSKWDWAYEPAEPLTGTALWGMMSIGFATVVATPTSFYTSPDMARYLPREASSTRIATATALGGAIPGTILMSLGALLATGVDMNDPVGAIAGILPAWMFPIFAIAVIVSEIAVNGMGAYSASLSLQSIGVPLKRIPAAIVVGVIGVALTIYSVAVSDFLTSVSVLLQLALLGSVPYITVYAVDMIMRRNAYNGAELLDERAGSRYWYTKGWNWSGIAAVALGCASAALCASTDLYVGPIADATGVDLSVFAGVVVTAVVYLVASRGEIRRARAEQVVDQA